MDFLDQVLNISLKDTPLSDEELSLINDILSSSGMKEVSKEAVGRVVNDFFYTVYVCSGDKGYIFVRVSPHEGIFDGELFISKQQRQHNHVRISSHYVASGHRGPLYYCVNYGPPCFPVANAKRETIEAITMLMAGMLIIAHTNYNPVGPPSQTAIYNEVFSYSGFLQSTPHSFEDRLEKIHPKLNKDFINRLSIALHNYFQKKVLDTHPQEVALCLGPMRSQDMLIAQKDGPPFVLAAPHTMVGSPIVDAACFPYYFNLNRYDFYKHYSRNDVKTFAKLDALAPFSWVPDFYLTFVDECMSSSLQTSFFNTSDLTNSSKYQRYRGWLSAAPELKEFVPVLDEVFLEKLIK